MFRKTIFALDVDFVALGCRNGREHCDLLIFVFWYVMSLKNFCESVTCVQYIESLSGSQLILYSVVFLDLNSKVENNEANKLIPMISLLFTFESKFKCIWAQLNKKSIDYLNVCLYIILQDLEWLM